jgi:hypothetical protein
MFKYLSNKFLSIGKWFTLESQELSELDQEIREIIYRNVLYVLFAGVAFGVLLTLLILQ